MTFPDHVKNNIHNAQDGFCKVRGCYKDIHSIHHLLPQTKVNIKKYPLLIHSPFNGVGLCEFHHRESAHLYRIDETHAKIYEDYLRSLQFERL